MSDVENQIADLGLDFNSTDFLLLGIVIQLSSESDEVIFRNIKQAVERQQGINMSRVWIYKVLKKLEREGFIEIIEFPSPTKYRSDYYIIIDALQERKKRIIEKLSQEEQAIEKTISLLKTVTPSIIGFHFYGMLARKSIEGHPTIVFGYDNTMHLIRNRIMTQAKPGDVIRIFKPLEKNPSDKYKHDLIRDHAYYALDNDVRMKILIHLRSDQIKDLLNSQLFTNKSRLSHKRYRNVEFRFIVECPPTYMMVSLNDSLMIMFLNRSSQHNFAALISSEKNRFLVNDAIRVFDNYWEQAHNAKTFVDMYSG